MKLTARALAELLGAELRGEPSREISGAAALESAGPSELAFAADPVRIAKLSEVRAACVLVPWLAREAPLPPTTATLLFVDDPRLAFARALRALTDADAAPTPARDQRAAIAPTAVIDPSARIDAFAVIGAAAHVGPRAHVMAHAVVGDGARLGADCVLHPHVTVYPGVSLGQRVRVHAGAVLGADGYGFVRDGDAYLKLEQVGTLVIEDDVEIGAGCTLDRAALGETRIGRGTKLDNLVHVGHNVRVGKNCLLVAQVGIAGSTELGDEVVLGGQAGVGGHLKLASGVRVGAQGGVAKSLPAAGDYWGTPARPHATWLEMLGGLSRIPSLSAKLRGLAQRVQALETRD